MALPKVRLKLVIAYEGTLYQGWQTQHTGVGVQQRIEEALARLFPSRPSVHGSSRTDTGVHAIGMVAHMDVPTAEFRMTTRKLVLALNAWLPDDIRIVSVRRAPAAFHARFEASGKQYRYTVWNHSAMNPLLRGTAWHVPNPLDLEAMRVAARAFLGRHDFRSLATTHTYEIEDTIRTLTRLDLTRTGPKITFILEGDGFLYKMCRGIVGTLVQVGQGKIAPGTIRTILAHKDRRRAGMTAPAHGLVLWSVFYRKSAASRKRRS
jgi:tRNA pseudouridine38-40 synthase